MVSSLSVGLKKPLGSWIEAAHRQDNRGQKKSKPAIPTINHLRVTGFIPSWGICGTKIATGDLNILYCGYYKISNKIVSFVVKLRQMDISKYIKKFGRISFRDFMEHALYCTEDGYYGAGKVKIGGVNMDFITHPMSTSPFFGRGLVRQIEDMWQLMRKPKKIEIVEIGGGYGVLARDILSEAKKHYPRLYRAIQYTVVEISPSLIKKQKKVLAHFKDKVDYWTGSVLNFNKDIEGVVISNELIDSLPVHRILFKNGKLYEVYVKYVDGEYKEELFEVSKKELSEFILGLGLKLFEGQHVCVSLDALKYIRRLSECLKKGFVITIDYGYLAEVLYGENLSHLRVAKDLKVGTYPYRNVAESDITSDVDFSSIIKQGRELGLKDVIFMNEYNFFKKWLNRDIDIKEGVDVALEQFVGSNYKVLVQEKI